MNEIKDYTIKTEVATQKNSLLDKDFFLNQMNIIRKNERSVDCFGLNWCLMFVNNFEGIKISVKSGKSFLPLNSNKIIFCPPFSLLETKMNPGAELAYTVIISSLPLKRTFNNPMMIEAREGFQLPTHREQILNLIEEFSQGQELIQQSKVSAIAEKFKKNIEQSYCQSVTINEIAKDMKVSREVLSRSFKEYYRLTPMEYRHRLRVFKALKLMNQNIPLGQISKEIGYRDAGQFITQFKRVFDATPKEYSPFKKQRNF